MNIISSRTLWLGGLLSLSLAAPSVQKVAAAETHQIIINGTEVEDADATADTGGTKQKRIIIRRGEAGADKDAGKEVTWLGVGIEEASDTVATQLGLHTGEGLVVNYVAPDSPAAKAGLAKDDVLIQLGDQMLLNTAQFRKLVRMHKEGDTVDLTFFRASAKQTLSVALGKTIASGSVEEGTGGIGAFKLNLGEHGLSGEMKSLQEELAKLGIDKNQIRVEIAHGMEEAHKALAEALHGQAATDANKEAVERAEKEIEQLGSESGKKTTVIVKKNRNAVKTMVTSDDSGTYVIVAAPNKRLTVHDKDGKLVFDGEVETKEQQDQVPKEIWEKVKPMLDKMGDVKIEGGSTARSSF